MYIGSRKTSGKFFGGINRIIHAKNTFHACVRYGESTAHIHEHPLFYPSGRKLNMYPGNESLSDTLKVATLRYPPLVPFKAISASPHN